MVRIRCGAMRTPVAALWGGGPGFLRGTVGLLGGTVDFLGAASAGLKSR